MLNGRGPKGKCGGRAIIRVLKTMTMETIDAGMETMRSID
jgi:hypothetical protein